MITDFTPRAGNLHVTVTGHMILINVASVQSEHIAIDLDHCKSAKDLALKIWATLHDRYATPRIGGSRSAADVVFSGDPLKLSAEPDDFDKAVDKFAADVKRDVDELEDTEPHDLADPEEKP